MRHPIGTRRLRWLALLVLLVPMRASAVDGVVEINHARALAGGVTPGDAPGYPVEINQGGSYVLTGSLVQPDPNTDVVEIDADDVTLDLNGFALTGSNACTVTSTVSPTVTASVSCAGSGSGAGVGSIGIHQHFSVYGGFIRGMGGRAIDLGNRARIHDIEVDSCGDGIHVGLGARVEDNLIRASGGDGIRIFANAVVRGNVVDGANGDGIDASAYAVIAHNSVRACGGIGIAVAAATLVRDNTIDAIADHGIRTVGEGRVIDNVVSRVQNAAITGTFTTSAGVSGNSLDGSVGWEIGTFVELGPNLCGGSTTCP